MKLDERIVLLTDIITCFNIEKAKSFIGQKGYFADIISSYQNLGNITYGTLTEIKDNDYPFEEDSHECWRFFIPEIRLKPAEPAEKIDEISVLKYKVEKLEKNLIELQRKLNN